MNSPTGSRVPVFEPAMPIRRDAAPRVDVNVELQRFPGAARLIQANVWCDRMIEPGPDNSASYAATFDVADSWHRRRKTARR